MGSNQARGGGRLLGAGPREGGRGGRPVEQNNTCTFTPAANNQFPEEKDMMMELTASLQTQLMYVPLPLIKIVKDYALAILKPGTFFANNISFGDMVHFAQFLFVVDSKRHSILVYNVTKNWQFVRTLGSAGAGAEQFNVPNGLDVHNGKLLICDRYNHRIQFIDISTDIWHFDAAFGSEGKARGQFKYPCDLAIAGLCGAKQPPHSELYNGHR